MSVISQFVELLNKDFFFFLIHQKSVVQLWKCLSLVNCD